VRECWDEGSSLGDESLGVQRFSGSPRKRRMTEEEEDDG